MRTSRRGLRMRSTCRRMCRCSGCGRNRSAESGIASGIQDLHPRHGLHDVCVLQGAQDREAKRLVDEGGALKGTQAPPVTNSPTGGVFSVHTAFAAIPARYALERGQWSEAERSRSGPLTPPPTRLRTSRAPWVPHAPAALPRRDKTSPSWSLFAVSYRKHRTSIGRSRSRSSVSRRKRGRHAAGKKNEAITLMQTAADREDASEKHVRWRIGSGRCGSSSESCCWR